MPETTPDSSASSVALPRLLYCRHEMRLEQRDRRRIDRSAFGARRHAGIDERADGEPAAGVASSDPGQRSREELAAHHVVDAPHEIEPSRPEDEGGVRRGEVQQHAPDVRRRARFAARDGDASSSSTVATRTAASPIAPAWARSSAATIQPTSSTSPPGASPIVRDSSAARRRGSPPPAAARRHRRAVAAHARCRQAVAPGPRRPCPADQMRTSAVGKRPELVGRLERCALAERPPDEHEADRRRAFSRPAGRGRPRPPRSRSRHRPRRRTTCPSPRARRTAAQLAIVPSPSVRCHCATRLPTATRDPRRRGTGRDRRERRRRTRE